MCSAQWGKKEGVGWQWGDEAVWGQTLKAGNNVLRTPVGHILLTSLERKGLPSFSCLGHHSLSQTEEMHAIYLAASIVSAHLKLIEPTTLSKVLYDETNFP